ncbi:MAG TPA: hypothetical protein VK841_03200, partial [Polyangiaceae bacterium]|nr:hypothetical protein [Polyangiaceae bacterium]
PRWIVQFVRLVIPSRVSWIVFALGSAIFGVAVARADEPGDLEKAYGAYAGHHYEEAESRLRALLDVKPGAPKDPDRIADVRMTLAAVLLAEGKKDEAGALLEKLLLDKPEYQPDPLRVSLPALDALVDARHRLTDKLVATQNRMVKEAQEHEAKAEAEKRQAAARLETMRRLASERIVVERHSRFEALLPFGVGQFQNRQPTLGVAFLTGESLLVAGSVIGFGLTIYNESLASQALQQHAGTAGGYQTRADEAAVVGNIFAAGLAAGVIGGILQAQIAFVPQHVHIEHGPLPPSVPPAPAGVSIAPVIGPGAIGLAGSF